MVFGFNFDLGLSSITNTNSILMILVVVWVGLCKSLSLLSYKFRLYHVPNFDKMIMKSPCQKFWENIVDLGVCRIVKQMGRIDPNNQVKIITFDKWLIVTLNWRRYAHPPIAPPNLGANLTSFKCYEPLSHTHHKSCILRLKFNKTLTSHL